MKTPKNITPAQLDIMKQTMMDTFDNSIHFYRNKGNYQEAQRIIYKKSLFLIKWNK